MKVCFFLDNSRIKDISLKYPQKGNPGIGGTEFMIWTVGFYLNKLYKDIEVYFLSPYIEQLPDETINIKCTTVFDAVKTAHAISANFLILRDAKCLDENLYKLIDALEVKTIMWSHNFEKYEYMKLANECENVILNICVSKEQYDRLRDHEIYKKSTWIYNALDFNIYNPKIRDNEENIVCYIGALRPLKGFHKLAQLWPQIEEKVPNAKLYVIGSGQLYDKNILMGKYGLASAEYEEKFIHYFLDDSGEIKKNIVFFGDLNHDKKIEVMSKSKVGIVNLIAKDETFYISAIEFQALGIPVVAKRTYGLLNTVDDKRTGILYKSDTQFVNSVVSLLKGDNYQKIGENGREYVINQFSIYSICKDWNEILNEKLKGDHREVSYKTVNYRRNLKWLRELNRRFKTIYFFKKLPAISEYPEVIYDMEFYKYLSKLKRNLR